MLQEGLQKKYMDIKEESILKVSKKNWIDSPTKQALQQAHTLLSGTTLTSLFATDPQRATHFSAEACNIYLDFSKHVITRSVWENLILLAKEAHATEKMQAFFQGAIVNPTEQRPALHTALRQPRDSICLAGGRNVVSDFYIQHDKMAQCVQALHTGQWRSASDQVFTDVVHLGIGGSELGPRLATEALAYYATKKIRVHYVSALDGAALYPLLAQLSPHATAFIIASKSFRTQETLENAEVARQWLLSTHADCTPHFFAITATPTLAAAWGVHPNATFEIDAAIGGRFSVWSPMGFPVALAIGMEQFEAFRAGAYAFDQHMRQAPIEKNLALILALLSVWHVNYGHILMQGILPYSFALRRFPAYVQQIEMESNGKSVSIRGEHLNYATSPVIWGSMGTNGQHAFHQWLHQGMTPTPVDIIAIANTDYPLEEHHSHLLSHTLAQSHTLMTGHPVTDIHAHLSGNRPSSYILLRDLSPQTVGALCALYEHKAFFQSVLWKVNAFDQYGVEFGKQVEESVFPCLKTGKNMAHLDASTQNLIHKIRSWQEK